MLSQDLHIHTVFSSEDSSIVPEQTIELVAFAQHAKVVGISDHFENFMPHCYNDYVAAVRKYGLLLTYLRHKIVKTYLISVLTILYLSIKGKNQLFRGTEFG